MKVLLINCPIRLQARPNNIPYGLATIASSLREKGFDVEIYDINALRPEGAEILDTLSRKDWDMVGVSGLITTYRFQKWLIPELKRINPHAPVVSGGGLATSVSGLVFKSTPVDFLVLGEGEETAVELCTALRDGRGAEGIAGVRFRQNGRLVKERDRPNIQNLDAIPFPAWDLLPMDVYLENPIWGEAANNSSGFTDQVRVCRSMNIISSRGCPFCCEYCYHLFGRSNYRFRSAENVIEEMELLVDRYGVDFVGFVDDNMMASEERLLRFCDLLEKAKLGVTWGCHGRVTSAHPQILRRMAEVGCVWIGYGIESGSQSMLDRMKKKTTVHQAKEAIVNSRRWGIFPNTTFIFGYSGESLQTIQETVDFKRQLGIECGSFFATPYPGTALYDRVCSGLDDEEAFLESLGDATQFSINLSGFDDETLLELKRAMDENRDVLPPRCPES
jgi:radical SAM superfamily enzyme YgiQ (UPF0313 family)